MPTPALRDVIAAMEQWYPPRLAADWDAVGLICGDPTMHVERFLLAIDPVAEVVDEAIEAGCDLVIVHHPLLLRPVHSVAATTPKGAIVHTLITSGIGLYCAHTNADHADPGVSDALAVRLGLRDVRPLVPMPDERAGVGTGRIGALAEPVTLEQFAELVALVLPQTAHGVRVAGDPQRLVRTVAVCGGSGDAFLADAAAVADVYVTSDLRHHRAQDHLADGGCALVDVAHWAGEWPWLEQAADALRGWADRAGSSVEVLVSTQPTDPWTAHRGSAP